MQCVKSPSVISMREMMWTQFSLSCSKTLAQMSAEGLQLKHQQLGIENGSIITKWSCHKNTGINLQQCHGHCIRHRQASLLVMHYTDWTFRQTSVNHCNDDHVWSNHLTKNNTSHVVWHMTWWNPGMNPMTIQQCFSPISTCVHFQNNFNTALF